MVPKHIKWTDAKPDVFGTNYVKGLGSIYKTEDEIFSSACAREITTLIARGKRRPPFATGRNSTDHFRGHNAAPHTFPALQDFSTLMIL